MIAKALIGALAGGFIGFLLRPSLPLVGQLPFDIVITRGNNLQGLDLMLKSTAEESFNYLLAGAAIGAVVTVVLLAAARNSVPAPHGPVSRMPPPQPNQGFCVHCGRALPPNAIFCSACGAKRQ